MKELNIFLKSLEKSLEGHYENTKETLVSRFITLPNKRFPAYTKFMLEVVEFRNYKPQQKFYVEKTENLSAPTAVLKEDIEGLVKDSLAEEMITMMLNYYIYGIEVK